MGSPLFLILFWRLLIRETPESSLAKPLRPNVFSAQVASRYGRFPEKVRATSVWLIQLA
jgi:hypothetical protein